MSKSTRIEVLKNLVAKKGVEAPKVTSGSSKERAWWPPFVVQQ
jgi:hypothetical protein